MGSHYHGSPPSSPPFTHSDFSGFGSSRSVMDMPVEGTKLAPRIFKGDPADVEVFLRRFERLAARHGLTEQEKCETVVDYCSKVVRETIEGFAAYRQYDWGQLKANIRIYWNADLESKRFRICDLQVFTARTRKESIIELRDWRRYLRRFIRIAGWLQGQKKLSDYDYAYYMWTGLPSSFRRRLEARLLLEDPHHDMSEPFNPENIRKAAEAILGIDRFDTERLGTEEWSESDSDEEPNERQEARERALLRGKKTSRKEESWKRVFEEDTEPSDTEELLPPRQERKPTPELRKSPEPRTKKGTQQKYDEDQEFKQMVDKMQQLSLDDPQYGFLYLRVCQMRPFAEQCLPKPVLVQKTAPRRDLPKEAPPHILRPDPPRFQQDRFQQQNTLPPMNANCFGCGEAGHMFRDCPIMSDFMKKGLVMKDYRGRYIRSDGSPIRRNPDETWAQAIRRMNPGVHFISYGGRINDEEKQPFLEEEEEEDNETADVMVYPVERSQRETRSYRKQAFDGVKVPSPDKNRQQDQGKGPQRYNQAPPRVPMQRLTPVETQQPTFNPDNDIEMVEDRTQTRRPRQSPPHSQAQPQNQPQSRFQPQSQPQTQPQSILKQPQPQQQERTKLPPRLSQLSKEVDSDSIMNRILDSTVNMTVREVVGVSKDIAGRLQDILKVRRAEFYQPIATNLVTTHTGPLIRVEVECNYKPVSFIVDTGSQLNIISEKVCKNIIRRPINTNEAISMNDANGGSGRLLGLVENVPIQFGFVKTPINAYIAENPPFDGLLGRPWQKAHKVGIEERDDGTYLTFPNKPGFEKYELLVDSPLDTIPNPGVYSAIVQEWNLENANTTSILPDDTDIFGQIEEIESGSDDPEEHDQPSESAADDEDSTSEHNYDGDDENSDNSDSEEEDIEEEDSNDEDLDRAISFMNAHEQIEAEEFAERTSYRTIRRIMQRDTPDIPPTPAGSCTIMTGTTLEFGSSIEGMDHHTFLLRNAELVTRDGRYQGHVIVKVIPYRDANLRLFVRRRNEPPQPPTVASISVGKPRSKSLATARRKTVTLPPLIKIPIHIMGRTILFLLDTGAQVNCIREDVWRLLGGANNAPATHPYIANATGDHFKCVGTWRTAVLFGTVCMEIDLLVVKGLASAGILGRPWQRQGQLWMEETFEGINLGVTTEDGCNNYGMFLAPPENQPTTHDMPAVSAASISQDEDVPEMDFKETHKLEELFDPPGTPREDAQRPETEPSLLDKFKMTYADTPRVIRYSNQQQERIWYEHLLFLFRRTYRHPVSRVQPVLTNLTFAEAEKLDMRRAWRTKITGEEEMFLLRNVSVKRGNQVRRGHAVLQIIYFPDDEDRIVMTPFSPLSGTLSEASTATYSKRKRTIPTKEDLEQSMEEVAFELRQDRAAYEALERPWTDRDARLLRDDEIANARSDSPAHKKDSKPVESHKT